MRRFYTDVLGFDVEWEPDGDNVYLTSGADNLALPPCTRRRRSGARRRPRSPGPRRAAPGRGRRVGGLPDAAGNRARRAAEDPPRRLRDRCTLSDPDGNRVQIIHHPPISDK